MGTNYYAVKNCPSKESPIHIGKSSCGWRFVFQEQNDQWRDTPVVWHTYEQVIEWLEEHTVKLHDYVIIDEYDVIISLDEFKKLVADKQKEGWSRHDKMVNGYRFCDTDFS